MGSEMCIRDSDKVDGAVPAHLDEWVATADRLPGPILEPTSANCWTSYSRRVVLRRCDIADEVAWIWVGTPGPDGGEPGAVAFGLEGTPMRQMRRHRSPLRFRRRTWGTPTGDLLPPSSPIVCVQVTIDN